jgi:hypothetical protein
MEKGRSANRCASIQLASLAVAACKQAAGSPMRIWTLHPKYLDPSGLTALWRETLLARAVLLNRTRGYKHHPQLERFRSLERPLAAINSYLEAVRQEATRRSYQFDAGRIGKARLRGSIPETIGQLEFEWRHLTAKLEVRNPAWLAQFSGERAPDPHPLFRVVAGPVRGWERGANAAA